MLRCSFARYGSPHVIVSDNPSSFTSKAFFDFSALCIKDIRCAPYPPSSNGLAECTEQIIKSGKLINACLSPIPYISAIDNGSFTSKGINGPEALVSSEPSVSRFICQSPHKNR